jgi:dethiobiotin synthase
MNHPRNKDVRPIVVTGTGTDVGKTYVCRLLLKDFRLRGVRPLGLKPVETGYDAPVSDAGALAKSAGHPQRVPLFTSSVAASPHRAARLAQCELRSEAILAWVGDSRVGSAGPCVVETAGGLFSPLSDRETMLDIVRALEPCHFVLVAPDRLGTLHDVTACITAAAALHRAPDVTVLNRREPNVLENALELSRLNLATRVVDLSIGGALAALGAYLLAAPAHTFNGH